MSRKTIADAFKSNKEKREIGENATVADAIDVMQSINYNCLLIKDSDGNGIGILSEHDIVSAFAKEGDNAKTSVVSDYMTMDIICIPENKTVDDAIKLMADRNIRHIPVISAAGKVVNFISIMELLMIKMAA